MISGSGFNSLMSRTMHDAMPVRRLVTAGRRENKLDISARKPQTAGGDGRRELKELKKCF